MNRILSFLLAVLSTLVVFAQQEPQFSQNMFNKLANNPGFSGSSGGVATSVLHRSQWMGFGDNGAAVSTQNFSVDAEVPFLNGGLGLNIVKDNVAQFSNLAINSSYAFRTQLGIGQIGMGISVGIFQSGLEGGFLRSAQSNDPAIPTGDVSGSKLDIGAGLYFNNDDMYIGISSAHMTEPIIEWSDGQDFNLSRHYFLIAGSSHKLDPMFSLNPSIYLKADGATSQLDINTNLIYNNKIWGGVTYRLDEGLILLTGMNLKSNKSKQYDDMRIGIAYDVTMVNPMGNSLEIMLGYNFKIKTTKAISKYKNPRFL